MYSHVILSVVLSVSYFNVVLCNIGVGTGTVQLDEVTFDKVINKFAATLVKFDVAFPYGEKHDAFIALSKGTKHTEDFLVAEVGVKDYGERDNEQLAKRYGVKKDDYPAVKLFLQGQKEPTTFSGEFTTEALRQFVKTKGGVHLSLPGCLPTLDKLAIKFSLASKGVKKSLLKEADQVILSLDEKDKKCGKVYKSVMEKITEKGVEFITTEEVRVNKLLSGQISKDKQKELETKLNILQSFSHEPLTKDEF